MRLRSRFELIEQAADRLTFRESRSYLDAIILGVSGIAMCGSAHYGMSTSGDARQAVALVPGIFLLFWAACGFIQSSVMWNAGAQSLCVQRRLGRLQFNSKYAACEIRRVYESTNPKSGRVGLDLELASGKSRSLTMWQNSACLKTEVALLNASMQNWGKSDESYATAVVGIWHRGVKL